MKTSIIVLTHNQLAYTKKCIESIRRCTQPEYEIIVVDNASKDDTVDYLKKQSDLRVIYNKENVGFVVGNNQAVNVANGDIIVFLNNDVVVTNGWLEPLIDTLISSDKIAMVGPVTNNDNIDGLQKVQVQYCEETLKGLTEYSKQYCVQHAKESRRVLRLVGFALACKREVLNEIGLFDEAYGMGYFEEYDLCLRALMKGYELRIVQDSFVHHFGNITFGARKREFSKLFVKNKAIFNKKWGQETLYLMYPSLDIVSMIPKTASRILDVGCGMGSLAVEFANQHKCEIVGIEKNSEAFAFAKKHLNQVFHEDIENMKISENKLGRFDCIICDDILGHLRDPWRVVQRLVRLLKVDGYFILSVHNISNLKVLSGLIQGDFSYKTLGILDKKHLRFFTKSTIPTLIPRNMLIENINSISLDATENTKSFINELISLGERYKLKTDELDATTVLYIVKVRKLVEEIL
ncbi:glycosyltransferase [Chengkuizengella axinellae]|uniref:Glycosyltransferase n=1 Tax=Chengkuizengella axinellae TaxID=3064388 RepID=A0ABT9J1L0_9BACL|nr:glycosyltransferase [Chengkuizengella sp. 2205SS18-9]MDP5275506.1 glycosyltransferase [Chengkuizengella sp. 2205SS18-9]